MNGQPTPGPWEWWTSCSWKRLTSKDSKGSWMKQGNVLCPTVASDGHPDLIVSEADMALIASAPDLLRLASDYRGSIEFQIRRDLKIGDVEGATMKRLTLQYVEGIISKATSPSTHDMGVVSHG